MCCSNHPSVNDHAHAHDGPIDRSHRRLGEALDLFHFADVAPGAPFWHPDGVAILRSLEELWRELAMENGMLEVRSPQVYDVGLWQRSGHAEKFADLMFSLEADGRQLGLKPMNCPAHAEVFASRPRSWRDLPMRLCEQGIVHRLEQSGNLNGLLRARQFVIDDAHVFCAPEQVPAELARSIAMSWRVYDMLGLEPQVELSLRPDQRLGSDADWDIAEEALAAALDQAGVAFERRPGEGAFYGPKVDVHLDDPLGRSWQLASVQLDRQLPGRLGVAYRDRDNRLREPVLIHRASFGSFERFVGLLLHRWDGWWPLWLAPRAVEVHPVGAAHEERAYELVRELRAAGVRADAGDGSRRLGQRVRAAQERRVPVLLVVGDRELASGEVVVERRSQERRSLAAGIAIAELADEVRSRALPPA